MNWTRPPHCRDDGACIEVAELGQNIVGMRLTHAPHTQLLATREEFTALVVSAMAGDYRRYCLPCDDKHPDVQWTCTEPRGHDGTHAYIASAGRIEWRAI